MGVKPVNAIAIKAKTKRKRHRSSSLEAEIRVKAKAIIAEREAEAYKAAALMICSRKLDEIRSILASVGLTTGTMDIVQNVSAVRQATSMAAVPQQPIDPEMPGPGEPACCQCGRKGIRKTRANRFNPTGSWFCKYHVVLAAKSDAEDNRDAAVLGADTIVGPSIAKKPILIQTHAPAKMVTKTLPLEPPQDAPGSASLGDAMAALGLTQ